MKYALLFMVVLLLVPSAFSLEIKGFVNDYAGMIDDDYESQIGSVLKQLYDSGTAQFAVVTVKSLEGKDIESYSIDLAQGVLGDKEKNNGLLLLVAVDDRQYRFEVGRGIEYILNDAKVGRIGREYLQPNLANGDYGKGILEASKAVKSIMMNDTSSEYYVEDRMTDEELAEVIIYLIIFFIIFILPIIAVALRHKKFKNRYFNAAAGAIIIFGGRGRGGFGGGGFGGGGAGGRF